MFSQRHVKLTAMFLPFVLFFVGLAWLVNELRHPQILHDDCMVMATGSDVSKKGLSGTQLYRQSESTANDVAMKCNRLGMVILNDTQLFQTDIGSGQGAEVIRKRYAHLPDRWSISVKTGIPKDIPAESQP